MLEITDLLVESKGSTIEGLHRMDYKFLYDYIEFLDKKNDPVEQRKKKWKSVKKVPIDQVF
ncbi:hypothetical protein BAPNAU_2966 [Bacillus velezensis NAU-B3]|nr:hypothetical protein BAPNAU_2966 [Bacillus velezensis NAU-B3]